MKSCIFLIFYCVVCKKSIGNIFPFRDLAAILNFKMAVNFYSCHFLFAQLSRILHIRFRPNLQGIISLILWCTFFHPRSVDQMLRSHLKVKGQSIGRFLHPWCTADSQQPCMHQCRQISSKRWYIHQRTTQVFPGTFNRLETCQLILSQHSVWMESSPS